MAAASSSANIPLFHNHSRVDEECLEFILQHLRSEDTGCLDDKATTSIEVKWLLVNRSQMMMGILQKSRKRYRFSFQYNWGHVSLEHLHYKRPTTDGLTLSGKIGRV